MNLCLFLFVIINAIFPFMKKKMNSKKKNHECRKEKFKNYEEYKKKENFICE